MPQGLKILARAKFFVAFGQHSARDENIPAPQKKAPEKKGHGQWTYASDDINHLYNVHIKVNFITD